jgi:hypothetical protein
MSSASKYYESLPKEEILCELCQSDRHETLFLGDRYDMGLRTVWCQQCGLVFVNSRPTALSMEQFYREFYRRFYESVEVPTQAYIDAGVYAQRAEFVTSMLRSSTNWNPVGWSLDIGCAEGSLLKQLGEIFPQLQRVGIEPNPHFAQFAAIHSGAEVHSASWESFLDADVRRFGLVTIVHVLEHCLHPLTFLQQIRSRMSDDAIAYIEVPDVGKACGLLQLHLAHLFLFYKETFLGLLGSAGLEVLAFQDENLPSLCPSMAAVVRKGSVRTPQFCSETIRQRIGFMQDSLGVKGLA